MSSLFWQVVSCAEQARRPCESASVAALPKKSWRCDRPGCPGCTIGSSGAAWLHVALHLELGHATLRPEPGGRSTAGGLVVAARCTAATARHQRRTATATTSARSRASGRRRLRHSAGRAGRAMASTSTVKGTSVAGRGRRGGGVGHVRLVRRLRGGRLLVVDRRRPLGGDERDEVEGAGRPVVGGRRRPSQGASASRSVGDVVAKALSEKQLSSAGQIGLEAAERRCRRGPTRSRRCRPREFSIGIPEHEARASGSVTAGGSSRTSAHGVSQVSGSGTPSLASSSGKGTRPIPTRSWS